MRNLLLFLVRYRSLLLFLALEVVAGWLIVRNDGYHGAAFYNSANVYVGRALEAQHEATEYLHLKEENRALQLENARLRMDLLAFQLTRDSARLPTGAAARADLDSVLRPGLAPRRDSSHATYTGPLPYRLIPARVINNSVRRPENFLTLDVGSRQGVRPGMGVVGPTGVVGRVKVVSERYATVVSILHAKTSIGARLKRDGTIGSVQWRAQDGGPGEDPRFVSLEFVPRHIQVHRGDTVVTSGYNAVFPPGIVIGRVSSVRQDPAKGFRSIQVRLAADLPRLLVAYVVESRHKPLRDSLEARSRYGEGAKGMEAEGKEATE